MSQNCRFEGENAVATKMPMLIVRMADLILSLGRFHKRIYRIRQIGRRAGRTRLFQFLVPPPPITSFAAEKNRFAPFVMRDIQPSLPSSSSYLPEAEALLPDRPSLLLNFVRVWCSRERAKVGERQCSVSKLYEDNHFPKQFKAPPEEILLTLTLI